MNNTKIIVNKILKDGYYLADLYSPSQTEQLLKYALEYDLTPHKIERNFNHPAYKLAVTQEVKDLLFAISKEKARRFPYLAKHPELICEENISISFPKKGPSFGNAKISKAAFHYDHSFVNLVLPLQLPKGGKTSGLFAYVNLKNKLGMGVFAKIISRLLGRLGFLRFLFRPRYLKYTEGIANLFFGDITLHGVGNCFDGNRVSLTINLEQISYEKYKSKSTLHKYLREY